MNKIKTYRGVTIEQTGIEWTAWMDFIHLQWMQPRFSTLAAARQHIAPAR